ncbi:phosphoribosylanthranilate isomerase [Tropicibacter sp. R15_0]|uniref:phosphoribosylanthranilate isomerase n=1 Tax=Tropicibacter sp. R15_0 TaxID=2821101 RepID=UPI001ADC8E0D|nr:phosphoribosylanthranilate isomerase [Tropicibacter sp. R15_0]MBO9465531.1 phosphoribosylanthranilate isomerase [Tropicibacter sp. R15_0]
MEVKVKICGLSKPADVEAVAKAGAAYAGFVFFPKSPRNVTVEQARDLAVLAPVGLAKVALVVNPDNALLDEICGRVAIDILQLHGKESPERVAEIRNRYGLPVMKAVGVATAEDLGQLPAYERVCDQILVDAKAPKGADLPGGNGLAFDWRLIAGRRWSRPWMLAGGLGPDNVARAVELTGASQVDVSSGVESAPGQKDAGLISDFVRAAQSAGAIPKL